eukprot:988094-Prymnesium_polylepis.1
MISASVDDSATECCRLLAYAQRLLAYVRLLAYTQARGADEGRAPRRRPGQAEGGEGGGEAARRRDGGARAASVLCAVCAGRA